MARPRRTEGPAGRPNRTPIGQRDVLTVPEHLKEPGFKYRFFNDDDHGDRIQRAQAAGYVPVLDKAQVGDANVGQASQFGVAGKPVGGGKKAVLMKIPSDWYEDDQAAKEAQIKENLQGLARDQNGQVPDHSTLYGEGVRIQSNKALPTIQED